MQKPSTPEEEELARKHEELARLESSLADRELQLATIEAELQAFRLQYLRIVGTRFAELDSLRLRLSRAALQRPGGDHVPSAAEIAAPVATEQSAETAAYRTVGKQLEHFSASSEAKRLYRLLARRIHPDLGEDDADRVRRTQMMAEVNRLYATNDHGGLSKLLLDWEHSPEAIRGGDAGAQLVRLIRQITRVQRRHSEIAARLRDIRQSELWQLRQMATELEGRGEDLLGKMAEQVNEQIRELQRQLEAAR